MKNLIKVSQLLPILVPFLLIMSVCRETPPIITDWNNTYLCRILTDVSLSACRTVQYLEPIFIHRTGNHCDISTNYTHRFHSTGFSKLDQAYLLSDNIRTLPPVALFTIPPNTTLIYDRLSISSLPTITDLSLTILNSFILNTLHTDVFDLYLPLTDTSISLK